MSKLLKEGDYIGSWNVVLGREERSLQSICRIVEEGVEIGTCNSFVGRGWWEGKGEETTNLNRLWKGGIGRTISRYCLFVFVLG